jgi:hypothetical protein
MHDVPTGRSVTGILHLANKTPMDSYSKKQATAETATFASEFVAAGICVEQIKDVCNTVRYLGVPIRDKSFMCGGNKSVVDSSLTVHAKLQTCCQVFSALIAWNSRRFIERHFHRNQPDQATHVGLQEKRHQY